MAEFIVLGAGMAGVGVALALQARGHTVTLVDRKAPGLETSYGNAGVIQAEAVEPYAIPRDLPTLLSYALGRSNDVVWHLRDLPRITPALWQYFRSSAPARHKAISAHYARLITRAIADHEPLIAASGSEVLIRRTGMAELHRSAAGYDAAATYAQRIGRDYDIPFELRTGAQIKQAEPDLKGDLAGMVLWSGPYSCTDPGALTRAYADLFAARGGRVLTGDAGTLTRNGAGWQVQTADGIVTASDVVVALGPWSPDLLARHGYQLPMVLKRGYHCHYQTTQRLNRPCLDAENGVVLASMRAGLRITTGAELTRHEAPQTLTQLDRGRRAAGELLDLGAPAEAKVWHGHRPCLPGMLPKVGAVPNQRGLWLNTGHGHQGFTLGPTTGAVLADIVDGRDDPLTRSLAP